MSAEQPRADRVAAALETARRGDDPVPELLGAVAAAEEVFVPLAGDGPSPMGMNDDAGPALVAFSDLERLTWTFPDGPQVALVPFGSIVAASLQALRPLRVDPTTPWEVRIDTAAAAALVEGRVPDDGIAFTGERFQAPTAEAPAAVLDEEAPRAHGDVRYVDADSGAPMTDDEARRRHDAGEPYAAVVDHDGTQMTVRVTADRTVSYRHDEHGRVSVVAGFSRVGDLLLHDYLETRDHAEGIDEPIARTIVRYRADGTMRVWMGGDDAMDTVDSSGVDLAWVPPVSFGDYRWVLDPR